MTTFPPLGAGVEQQGTSKKTVLDEAAFQQLLSAAFLLQQHNDRLMSASPKKDTDPAQSLSEIVETQNRVHSDELTLDDSLALIAERVRKITGVEGVAIGVIERELLKYRAAVGTAAGALGTVTPLQGSLSTECLKTGQLFLSPDATRDARVPQELAQKRQTRAFVSLPVYYEQRVAGVLELCASVPRRFEEKDLRLCQLMAGLITECIAKATEAEWKQALAAERAAMLEALEKIKPQLQKMVGEPQPIMDLSEERPSIPVSKAIEHPPAYPLRESVRAVPRVCSNCAQPLDDDQLFCGICGTECGPRVLDDSQDDWASMWRPLAAERERLSDKEFIREKPLPSPEELAGDEGLPLALREIIAKFSDEEEETKNDEPSRAIEDIGEQLSESVSRGKPTADPEEQPTANPHPPVVLDQVAEIEPERDLRIVEVPLSEAIQPAPWHSAHGTKAWLESLHRTHPAQQWLTENWKAYRGAIYLSVASIVLLAVVLGMGPLPDSHGSRASQKPKLTFFETVLVNLGLAEMPQPATVAHPGNPQAQVWIDVHTALYYCAGADLYGKTPGGRVVSQWDAQQDQYEPAFRHTCD